MMDGETAATGDTTDTTEAAKPKERKASSKDTQKLGLQDRAIVHRVVLVLLANNGGAFDGTMSDFAAIVLSAHKRKYPFNRSSVIQNAVKALAREGMIELKRGFSEDPRLRNFGDRVVTRIELTAKGTARAAAPPADDTLTVAVKSTPKARAEGKTPRAERVPVATAERRALIVQTVREWQGKKLPRPLQVHRQLTKKNKVECSRWALYHDIALLVEEGVLTRVLIDPEKPAIGFGLTVAASGVGQEQHDNPSGGSSTVPALATAGGSDERGNKRLKSKEEIKAEIADLGQQIVDSLARIAALKASRRALCEKLEHYDERVAEIADLLTT